MVSATGATIRGRVVDSNSGLQLQSARVTVEGVEREVSTERGGGFEIRGLAPGTYIVRASHVGYPSVSESVTLADTDTVIFVSLDFNNEEIVELEAFSVEGSLVGSAKAINRQRSASAIKNIVASDAIGQFVDRNAAEALQRLPGIAIEQSQGEGKFVTIRGLDPSMNEIAIDGVVAATPEADGRSTALNIISVDQLESIEVSKSWLPDQSANFIGGSVNLVTRSALDRGTRFASADFAYGQYAIADEGSFRVNATYSDVFLKKKNLGLQISLDFSEDNRGSETLLASYDPDPKPDLVQTTVPAFGWQLESLRYEDFTIRRERTGISGKLEYEASENHKFYFSISSNQFDDDEVLVGTSFIPDIFRETGYAGRTRLTRDVATELGYDPDDPAVAMRISSSDSNQYKLTWDEAIQLGEIGWDAEKQNLTFQIWDVNPTKSWRSIITNDQILTIQGGGEHRLWDRIDLDFKVYHSDADKHQDIRFINPYAPRSDAAFGIGPDGLPHFAEIGDEDIFNNTPSYRILQNPPRGNLGLSTQDFTDTRTGFEVNLEVTYRVLGLDWTTKIGFAGDYREKTVNVVPDNFQRVGDLATGELTPLILSEPFLDGGLLESFLDSYGDYSFGPVMNVDGTRAFIGDPESFGFFFAKNPGTDDVADVTGPLHQNYVSSEDVFAGYLMQTLDWRGFKFIAGFRYEETTNSITNRLIDPANDFLLENTPLTFASPAFWPALLDLLGPETFTSEVTNSRTYENVLPAFHVIKRFGEQTVVRASYTETIARPKFTDLLPFEIVRIADGRFQRDITLGNYDLEPTGSKNFDLSFERYFKRFGEFSIALFHKELDGPIYEEGRAVSPRTSPATELSEKYDPQGRDNSFWYTQQTVNAGMGKITGVELSLQRKLDFLPGPLDGFGFQFNYTLSDSSVELQVDSREGEVVQLFKHSDKLANLSVYYEKRAFMVRVSMLWRGGFLDAVETSTLQLARLHEGGVFNNENPPGPLGVEGDGFDTYVDDYFKLDVRAQYRFKNNWTIFFEGTNLTDEPVTQYQGDPSRVSSLVSTEPVYFLGIQWSL